MERARIVAGASQKLEILREYIAPYAQDNNILVYCEVRDAHVSDVSLELLSEGRRLIQATEFDRLTKLYTS